MKEVRTGLYIGDLKDANSVLSTTTEYPAITHMLSVLNTVSKSVQLEELQLETKHITRLWVPWHDTEEQNILDTLEHCLQFIEQALRKGSVLVHCLAGISRSATVVTAYLMKSEQLSLEDALSSLVSASQSAAPNPGFISQLKLFENMGFKVDRDSHIYKQFHVEKLGEAFVQGMEIDNSRFASDPACQNKNNLEQISPLLYRCKKCRRIVASQENVLMHQQESKNPNFSKKKDRASFLDENKAVECTSLFVEPMQWMAAVQEGSVMGKLSCATCDARLGSFNWAGAQCSCGAWVVPSFQLHKSRVDVSKF